MPGRNTKALTDLERQSFKNDYIISVKDDYIIVRSRNINKTTAHSIDSPFFLLNKGRKLTFTTQVIKLWIDELNAKGYDLIDTQNAANVLYILKQDITSESIEAYLKRGDSKITVINDNINYNYKY